MRIGYHPFCCWQSAAFETCHLVLADQSSSKRSDCRSTVCCTSDSSSPFEQRDVSYFADSAQLCVRDTITVQIAVNRHQQSAIFCYCDAFHAVRALCNSEDVIPSSCRSPSLDTSRLSPSGGLSTGREILFASTA